MATHYDVKLAKDYANKWSHDTPRRSAIYSTWLEVVGDVKGLHIVDLACGSGTTSRMLAERGALVVGIDNSSDQLQYAREAEAKTPLGIKYYLSDARDISSLPAVENFDMVTPTFLFNYASNIRELKLMVESCARLTRSGGRLCAITINPFNPTESAIDGEGSDVSWVNESRANQEGSELEVQLYYGGGNKITPFITHFFSSETYESVLKEMGFLDIRWAHLKIPEKWKGSFPKWEELEKNTSVIIVSATKRA